MIGDLWSNKTRTLLVVMSIFIGIFAVGMITSSQVVLARELRDSYIKMKPAHATIRVPNEDRFDDDLVQTIRNMPEVADAEGRSTVNVRVLLGAEDWRDLQLTAVPDYDDIRVNVFQSIRGATEPDDKTMLLERSGLRRLGLNVGDSVLVELPNGKQRTLEMSGVVHDLHQESTEFSGTFHGYVTPETMEWLGEPRDYNELLILVAGDSSDQEYNREVAELVRDKIQKSGRNPLFPQVPTPGQHPANDLISGIILLMGAMGILSVFLSGFLVTNTISALLAQQIKQIGIMKSVGAQGKQIMQMYFVLVLCFGLIALAIALPLAQLATRGFTGYIAFLLNFDLQRFDVPAQIFLVQLGIGLMVPLLAAFFPVLFGTRVTIREALSAEASAGKFGNNMIDRVIQQVRGLPRPMLISLRNTFRRKGRVVMTLVTLTLGGAIFIAIFSIQDSLLKTVDDVLESLFNYDVVISLDRTYRADYLISEAKRVPGVVDAESWNFDSVRRILPDDQESLNITMFAVPPETNAVQPRMIEGRWLLPEDQNALVISTGVLNDDPDIEVGDEIILTIRGREEPWEVVGVMQAIGSARWAYSSFEYYGRVARSVDQASNLRIFTEQRTLEYQSEVANRVEEHFKRLGINVSSTGTTMEGRQQFAARFQFIVSSLLIMSVLIAVVGGLGLAGTMSMNVLERTREIGVMRAIGASDGTVLQIVVVEGIVIGLISWMLGASLAFPISKLLSDQVGLLFFRIPLSFSFSVTGMLYWLTISMVLAALASFLPAWSASRLTVRDVLAYE
ncbi:MAG: ABC transporter permease [Chloroflexaceae bacterium]|nr:ABC transporter permease [Chloroflexaceae bacterium]